MSKVVLVRHLPFDGVLHACPVPYAPGTIIVDEHAVGWWTPGAKDQDCYYVQWVNGYRSYWDADDASALPEWLEEIHE